jgi:Tol biopolymer transport system component
MLAKDAEERYQLVREVRTNLKKLSEKLSAPDTAPAKVKTRSSIRLVAVALLALVVVTVVFLWPDSEEVAEQTQEGPSQHRTFTFDGKWKSSPQLSPDGNYVSYRANVGTDNLDIFVKSIGEETTPQPLTSSPENERYPVWSPNGKQIAFVRETEQGDALYTKPAPLGGQERKVIDLAGPRRQGEIGFQALSWSPNGDWIAKAEKYPEDQPSRIVLISPKTGETKPLTNPPPEILVGDAYPSFSPNGSSVAFVRFSTHYFGDFWIQALEGEESRKLTSKEYGSVSSPTWIPNGREIVFAAGRAGFPSMRLFRLSLEGGEPHTVAGTGSGARDPFIRDNRLVYVQAQGEHADIWRVRGPSSDNERDPERIVRTNPMFQDEHVSVSPDGLRIAFSSSRSDAFEIWVKNADGSSEAVRLTRFDRLCGWPSWSPDGHRIVFSSNVGGNNDVYIVDTEGGEPTRLTDDSSDDNQPSCSHDGRWIYFTSDRSGRCQIWKIPFEGGEAIQITKGFGVRPTESEDGKYVYYHGGASGTIWRVPVEGGEEEMILDENVLARNFCLQGNRLYYGKTDRPKGFSIGILDLDSGRKAELFRKEGPVWLQSVAAAPDGKWVYYASFELGWGADIMLVENFR